MPTEEVGRKLCEKLAAYNVPYLWNDDPTIRVLVSEKEVEVC